jgi:uncharacterized protein (TIGR03663 family)
MNWPTKFLFAALTVLIIAAGLRTSRLDIRPMHGDEAIHAYKFGQLLEQNYYRYDPAEFHGPTLNYFTLIPAWLSGKHTYASLTESTLRIVPVFFGLLLVLMPLLLVDGLGKPAALITSAFTAISPAFVFYSRYYIQEMLFVCFTFGLIAAGYRYVRSKKIIWALLAGLFAGLCHATKETCVIAFGSMLLAIVIMLIGRRGSISEANAHGKIKIAHLIAALVVALCVSGLFFSSFFANLHGVLDSFKAYSAYFSRAGGSQHHIHPWFYYLKTLLYSKSPMGPPWTEGFVVILALAGAVLIVARKGIDNLDKRLLDFLVLYTAISLIVYSAIPYKTPWCLLGFYHGMILLAAVGIIAILNLIGPLLARIVVSIFFLTAAADLCLQAFLGSFVSFADTSNPYVYSQPTTGVLKITEKIEKVSQAYPTRREMPIWVVCPNGDYWPLPWYLRSFKNAGWWNDVNEITLPAPVVIAAPELEDRLINRLFNVSPAGKQNLYVPLFDTYIELRPGVELRGYVTKDLLDKLQKSNAEH